MNIFLFLAIAISITNILVREFIFEWFRNFFDKYFHYSMANKLVHCETCMGFWVGVGLSFLTPIAYHWIICGLLSSIANKTYHLILIKF